MAGLVGLSIYLSRGQNDRGAVTTAVLGNMVSRIAGRQAATRTILTEDVGIEKRATLALTLYFLGIVGLCMSLVFLA